MSMEFDGYDDAPPRRLMEIGTPAGQALSLLAVASTPARARHQAIFEGALVRAGRQSAPRQRTVLVFATACALGCLGVVGVHGYLRPSQVSAAPELVAASGARYRLEGRLLDIESGSIRLHPRRPLTVRAAGIEVVVHGAQVLVDVRANGAQVSVESGEAVVRYRGEERQLRSGEQFIQRAAVAAPPPEQAQVAPLTVPALSLPTPRCNGSSECLSAVAKGSTLEAQTALYELALNAHQRGELAQAAALFDEYSRRFPTGVLAPEASVGAMLSKETLGDRAGADREAELFLQRFSADVRAPSVKALLARP